MLLVQECWIYFFASALAVTCLKFFRVVRRWLDTSGAVAKSDNQYYIGRLNTDWCQSPLGRHSIPRLMIGPLRWWRLLQRAPMLVVEPCARKNLSGSMLYLPRRLVYPARAAP